MSHEKELARTLTYRKEERMDLLRAMPLSERSAVFEEFSPYVQQAVIKELKDHELVDMLDNMDMRHAEGVLARVQEVKRRARIVRRLKGEIKEKTEYFLRFHPQATLSLINFNYLFYFF